MITRKLPIVLILMFISAAASAGERFRVDDEGAILTTSGAGELIVAESSTVVAVQVSGDAGSVAWLPRDAARPDAETDKLFLRSGGVTRTINCEPVIRDFWFVDGARRIAIDCGGRHFAGREILYDAVTLKVVDSFDQAEVPQSARPVWAR